ncbi:MAG: hypothetical protein V1704_00530 [Candidatus Vogelbacteria bacterium]
MYTRGSEVRELFFHKIPEKALRDKEKVMEQPEIAQQLLRGSRNIDLMKNRVKQVIHMVLGCIDLEDTQRLLGGSVVKHFLFPQGTWIVYTTELNCSRTIVRCIKRANNLTEPSEEEEIFVNCDNPEFKNGARDVRFVYKNLSSFVEGMITIFPTLEERLRPFIEASDDSLDL